LTFYGRERFLEFAAAIPQKERSPPSADPGNAANAESAGTKPVYVYVYVYDPDPDP
jgi:hypothetical protein